MDQQRLEMVTAVDRGVKVADICEVFRVSRETFYKWRRRYLEHGPPGLVDRSSRPLRPAGMVAPALEAEVVALRRGHPRWGSRRLAAELRRVGTTPPAQSTIDAILRRNGLLGAVAAKPAEAVSRFEREHANELWQMDGIDVEIADGVEVKVITCLDDHSRVCPGLHASLLRTAGATITAFDKAATNGYGLPYSVLADNGTEFTSRRRGAVGAFERHLWQLGIATLNGRPAHPQTQGKVERFHRTLREWLADWVSAHGPLPDVATLNSALETFRVDYNTNRPHQGLADDRLPQDVFDAAVKAAPDPQATARLRTRVTVRHSAANGNVSYGEWFIGVGRALADTTVVITDYGSHIDLHHPDGSLIRTVKPDSTRTYLGTGNPPGRPKKR